MRLFPKKLTDDEFVEKLRKNLHHFKWMIRIFIPLFIICLIVVIIMYSKLLILFYEISSKAYPNLIYYHEIGLYCGFVYGTIFCIIFLKGIIFLMHRFGNRTEKLVIKYMNEAGRLGIKNEKDIVYSQLISNVIEKSRGIRWLWVVAAIILFISLFAYDHFSSFLDKKIVSFMLFSSGLKMGFMLAEKILVIIIPLFILLRTNKRELLLIKYYDIVKERSGTVSSENEFKNGFDNQLTDN